MLENLIRKTRSCRRFYQNRTIDPDTLKGFVNLARLSASAANLQPLKYVIVSDPDINHKIFPCLAWAGYLKDWKGPDEGERPSAYIFILGDTKISTDFGVDPGIACQSIMLGIRDIGLAGCVLGSIDRQQVREILEIDPHLEILLVIALGKPKEQIVIEEVEEGGDIRYWRDSKGIHHVPKRDLNDVIAGSFFP